MNIKKISAYVFVAGVVLGAVGAFCYLMFG